MFRKIKYLFSCIFRMDYKALFSTVKKVHKLSGKSRIYLFFDIVICGFKYGAGYMDYLLMEFYKLNKKQRATYVTRTINNTITRMLNNPEYYHYFDNKEDFYETFKKYMGREWLKFDKASFEEFDEFMKTRDMIICKPSDACCGQGVEKLYKKDFKDTKEMYDKLKSLNADLVEDVVIQHPRLQEMNDGSVNTIRVVTMTYKGVPHIAFAGLRIGNSDRPVDNINAGGMSAPVDIETGIINFPGCDKDNITYQKHPRTGCPIVGFEIPCWEEAKKMVLEAAMVIPEMGYVGWDVCITDKNEAIFIEGNNLPGHDIYQMPAHIGEDKIGILPRFRKIIPEL